MKIYERLYVGETVNNPDKLLHKLDKADSRRTYALFLHAYVIIMARNEDQLEIHEARFLTQKYYRQHPPYIIGIAGTHEEAIDLVVKIAADTYAARGDCDIKGFLSQTTG